MIVRFAKRKKKPKKKVARSKRKNVAMIRCDVGPELPLPPSMLVGDVVEQVKRKKKKRKKKEERIEKKQRTRDVATDHTGVYI